MEYTRNRRAKSRFDFFVGKSCCWCGSTKDLELDHIDASSKEIEISSLWDMRLDNPRRIAELNKCQVLCDLCHQKKSKDEKAKGENNGMAKLTWGKVREIREIYATASDISMDDLANQYGVHLSLISYVVNNRLWKE